ncbi:hypothetical protein F5879DRAFT_807012 [Lentinula edodes]|nr:hypothetical protein F5879DRAFT_807012 [Lentinula edodes]
MDKVDFSKGELVSITGFRGQFNVPGIPKEHREYLADRYQTATRIAAEYLNRKLSQNRNGKPQLSRADRKPYQNLFEKLDTCLLNWRRLLIRAEANSESFYVYALEFERVLEVLQLLRKVHDQSKADFRYYGEHRPSMPIWGVNSSPEQWWDVNDAECMAAAFRVEVEEFLANINKYTRNRKENNTLAASKQFSERFGQNLLGSHQEQRRDLPPHISVSQQGRQESSSVQRGLGKAEYQKVNNGEPPSDPSDDEGDDDSRKSDHRRNDRQNYPPFTPRRGGGGPPSDPGDPYGGNGGSGGKGKPRRRPNDRDPEEPRFDEKLKSDVIPTWDGDMDKIITWETQINDLAKRSVKMHQQLGHMVPPRLRESAQKWYYSLTERRRDILERDWTTLKEGINRYYMNRQWMDDQKRRANKASYRDSGASSKETPSEYFIRKKDLLTRAYDYTDTQLIAEIVEGAPVSWVNTLTPYLHNDIDAFQEVVRFHEEDLIRLNYRSYRVYENNQPNSNSYNRPNTYQRRVNLIGATANSNLSPPQFPKDDNNVSTRNTPEDKGARPCRHCGSGKHWDNECKYSRRSMKKVRMNHIQSTPEDEEAQREYDELYYGLSSNEENSKTDF